MTQAQTSQAQLQSASAAASAQYLTFVCGGEEYGVEILRVQEIKGWEHVTRVPYAPPYVLGVMNLRGMIVPVIDLRTRLNLEQRKFDASTVVIVVRVQSTRGEKTVGIVVDAVSEVYSVQAESIKPVPELGGIAGDSCVKGIATVEGKMVMLLDINSLVAACVETDTPRALNG
ncbi:MAG TPA: chemotaxis protein CheW [Steroidobacteraceae bacterium]